MRYSAGSVLPTLSQLQPLCVGFPLLRAPFPLCPSVSASIRLPARAGPDSPYLSRAPSLVPMPITARTALHGTAPAFMCVLCGTEGRSTRVLSQGPTLSQRRVGKVCSMTGGWVGGWKTWPFWALLCENPSMAEDTADAHILLQLRAREQLPRARDCW